MTVRSRTEHRFSWWHQGVLLFDRTYVFSEDFDEYTEAGAGDWLGQSRSPGVTFVSPGGAVFSSEGAPLTVEVFDQPPALLNEAESVGEFDLLLPSGELVMAEQPQQESRPDRYVLHWPLRAPGHVTILRGY